MLKVMWFAVSGIYLHPEESWHYITTTNIFVTIRSEDLVYYAHNQFKYIFKHVFTRYIIKYFVEIEFSIFRLEKLGCSFGTILRTSLKWPDHILEILQASSKLWLEDSISISPLSPLHLLNFPPFYILIRNLIVNEMNL